jgi:DNA-binding CsgD family transcriptional regulator
VKIAPNVRSLRVELCGQYAIDRELLFRTRLYPLEDNFTRWTSLSYWDFITLPAGGHYRLDIEMMEGDTGKVYSRSLPVELIYPWYLSWWARVIYIIVAVMILLYTIWIFYKKAQRSKARLADEKNAEIYQQQLRILQLENDKSQNDLRNKSQELSNFLLAEASRREWNDEVLMDIRRIIDYINAERYTEARNKLLSLQGRLSRSGEKTIEWKRFEENFDIVNNQFITRLSKHYPWMSKQERRLCVYIHIGLSSKEIAPLLNISTRAVEMMRYRIRNKMQIDSSISLKQYFNEIQQMN